MTILLTMAGKYSRFQNEGYKIPKYLLPYGNRSILSEIINELVGFEIIENIFLIANERDSIYMGHVRKIMLSYGIKSENLILIDDTSGQAETAKIGITHFNPSGHIVCHNIDTILYNRNISEIDAALNDCDGYIDVFQSNNHAYSYVITDNKKVIFIGEKVVLSNLATSGLYGFSSVNMFNRYFCGQKYISELYKQMIADRMKICVGDVYNEKDTIVLGTPLDYLKISELL